MLGGLLTATLTFDPASRALLSADAGVLPLVTHYSGGQYTTYPLDDYTDALAGIHGIERQSTPFSVDYLRDVAAEVLGDARITQP
jgi:hypothetical protein